MVELVDTLVLGTSAERLEGSNPSLSTRRLLLIHRTPREWSIELEFSQVAELVDPI